MAEKRKVQLETEVVADTSGLDAVADAFQHVAQVGQSAGQQAAQGLDAISQRAGPAAEALDSAQRRMQSSIERTLATMKAGQQGTADYFEALARSRGINTAPFDAYIGELRRVEQAQRASKQATADAAKADAFIASLQQQANAVGRTRAEILALQAAQMGLTDKVAPYIQKLREADQGQTQLGMSAKATTAALRGVPAQFTDIITSLQGGQRPITVLLQQGGQLKDMFGGIGPAARALGGYVAGLVNPFTIAAAAAVGLGFALVQGAKEHEAYQRALIVTGNAAGATASQLGDMARALGSGGFTQSQAAAGLAEIVEHSGAATDQLKRFTAASLEWEKATGQAVSKTAAQFKDLEEAPLAASVKLNAEIHHLTAALYEQIKALDEQGRHQDAARVATDAYAEALESRSKQIIANNGFLVTSWDAVSLAIRKAANAVLDFGRNATGSEQLTSLKKDLAIRQERGPLRPQDPASVAAFDAGNKVLRDQIELIETLNKRQAEGTQEQAKQNRELQNKTAWDQQGVQFATKRQQLDREITRAEIEGQALVRAGLITEEQLRTRLANIREKYKETGAAGTGQSEVAAIQARVREQQQYLQQLQQQLATGLFGGDAKLTEGEKKVIDIQEQLKTSISGVARAEKERALAAAQQLAVADRLVLAQDRQNKAYQEALGTITKQTEANDHLAVSYQQQAAEQNAVAGAFGKSEIAIKQLLLAQNSKQIADAEATDRTNPAYLASLYSVRDGLVALLPAMQAVANKQAALSNANLATTNQQDADLLQLELSLTGQTQEVRQRIVEQRRIELDYARKIADVDKLGLTPADTAARKAELATQQVIAVSNAGARATLDEWQRTTDSINASLTDALLRGFESGKGFVSNFRDTLKNMFGTLVLRPIIQGVMSPVSGALTSIGQGIAGSITGGGGSALGGSSSLLSTVGSAGSLVGLGSSIGTAFTAGSSSVGVMAGSLAGSGGLLGGAASAMAAMGPVGWAALAATVAYSIFSSKGGGPKTESGTGLGVRQVDPAAAQVVVQAIQDQYQTLAKALGGTAGNLNLGVFSAQDPKGTAQTQLAVNAALNGQSIYSRAGRLGGIENVGRSSEELTAAVAEESKRVVLQALQATNLPGQVGDFLRQLGDINGLTGGALDQALTRAQTIATQRAQLEQRLADLVDTAEQKLIRTRQQEKDATDDLNLALLDQINSVQDLQDALGRSMTALQTAVDAERASISNSLTAVMQQLDASLKSSMAIVEASVGAERDDAQRSFTDAMRALQVQIDSATATVTRLSDLAGTLHSARDTFTTDPLTGMQHGEASAAIQAAIAIAKAQGTLPDPKALQASLDVLTRPSQDMYASFVDYARARDKDAADIQALAGLSDDSLSTAEQQLKATQDQAQATQDAFDETNARLDGILATAKAQVDAATGTTVAVMDSNAALTQLLGATNAYATQFGAAQAQLAAENARLDGVLAAAQAQVAMAQGTTVAVIGVQAAINSFNSSLLAYLAARDAANTSLNAVPAPAPAPAPAPTQLLASDPRVANLSASQFNEAAYLAANLDVAAVNGTPAAGGAGYAYRHFLRFGRYEQRPLGFTPTGFAEGGAFTNGIYSRPTAFAMGLMGERQPEAVMPLANVGGSLGVRVLTERNQQSQQAADEMRAMLAQANEMLRSIAQHAARSARNTGDLVDRGITVRTDSDAPLAVQTP